MSSEQNPLNAGHPDQPGSNFVPPPSPPGAILTLKVYSKIDPEDPTRNEANDNEEKIYSLIKSQLLFTFGVFLFISFLGFNLILHIIFTVATSIFIGVTSRRFPKYELLLALKITIVLCFYLTLFASLTESVFVGRNIIYGVSFLLIPLFIFGIITMFFVSYIKIIIYGALGVILFSFCFIIDIQLVMMNDKDKYLTSPEKYGLVELSLYNFFMSIFLYILMIIGGSNCVSRD